MLTSAVSTFIHIKGHQGIVAIIIITRFLSKGSTSWSWRWVKMFVSQSPLCACVCVRACVCVSACMYATRTSGPAVRCPASSWRRRLCRRVCWASRRDCLWSVRSVIQHLSYTMTGSTRHLISPNRSAFNYQHFLHSSELSNLHFKLNFTTENNAGTLREYLIVSASARFSTHYNGNNFFRFNLVLRRQLLAKFHILSPDVNKVGNFSLNSFSPFLRVETTTDLLAWKLAQHWRNVAGVRRHQFTDLLLDVGRNSSWDHRDQLLKPEQETNIKRILKQTLSWTGNKHYAELETNFLNGTRFLKLSFTL